MKRIMLSIVCISLIPASFANADVSDKNAQLIQAAKNGNLSAVQTALADGANIDAKDTIHGSTVLIWAAGNGRTEVVKLLLEKGADVNAKNNSGKTALMVAAFKGYEKIVNILLEKGADINLRAGNGETAIEAAKRNGQTDIVRLLEKANTKESENVAVKMKEKPSSISSESQSNPADDVQKQNPVSEKPSDTSVSGPIPIVRDNNGITASSVDDKAKSNELSAKEKSEDMPWRIVTCCSNSFIPNRDGSGVIVFGNQLPPLMITIEIDGRYPGLPKLEVTQDFTFWDTVNNRKITPYQIIVVPREIPASMVGDRTKTLLVSVYLCNFIDNGFSRMTQGGYKAEWVAVSYKGGGKLPMTQKEPEPNMPIPVFGTFKTKVDSSPIRADEMEPSSGQPLPTAVKDWKPTAVIILVDGETSKMDIGLAAPLAATPGREYRLTISLMPHFCNFSRPFLRPGEEGDASGMGNTKLELAQIKLNAPKGFTGNFRVSKPDEKNLKLGDPFFLDLKISDKCQSGEHKLSVMVPVSIPSSSKVECEVAFTVNVCKSGEETTGGKEVGESQDKDSDPETSKTGKPKVVTKEPEVALEKKAKDLLPAFKEELQGSNPVRVKNPNSFAVATGLRSGGRGKNFDVPANGVETVYVPDGRYDIYFVYSNKPDALFQGDSFTLNNDGVEIQIVKVVNGNYNIRQVK
jgi:hypothetical protein